MTRIYTYQCENAVNTSRDHISQLTKRGVYSRAELAEFIRALRAELLTLDLVLDAWEIADAQDAEDKQRNIAIAEEAAKAEEQEQQEQAQPTEQKQQEYLKQNVKSCNNCKNKGYCTNSSYLNPVEAATRCGKYEQKGDQA
ncbi:MAG: hypothetical protein Q4C88_08650 [Akkermansia sp.]|nr:hypothetical protein [Akkermansia sp.]